MALPLSEDAALQPYTSLLYGAVRELGVEVVPYRTRAAVADPPDVVHLHWPEHVLHRRGPRKLARATVLLAALALARRRGASLVYTAHNAVPHDLPLGVVDRWFLRAFDRQVDAVLSLTASGIDEVRARRPGLRSAIVHHTRHGDFRGAVPPASLPDEARARFGIEATRPTFVFAGQVRPYKGVDHLLRAADELDADVLVAGRCPDPALAAVLEERARRDERVHLHLAHLEPDELALAVSAASVVVLPYRQVLNSGAALLALSLERPVLVPDRPTFRELRREVGEGWVRLFRGDDLAPADLQAALGGPPAGVPDLSRHAWSEVAAATVAAYRDVVLRTRRRERRPLAAAVAGTGRG